MPRRRNFKSPVRRTTLNSLDKDNDVYDVDTRSFHLGDTTHCRVVAELEVAQNDQQKAFLDGLHKMAPPGCIFFPIAHEVSHTLFKVRLPSGAMDVREYQVNVRRAFPQAILREAREHNTDYWRLPYMVSSESALRPVFSACSVLVLLLIGAASLGGAGYLMADVLIKLFEDAVM